jgi:hypothetical protein
LVREGAGQAADEGGARAGAGAGAGADLHLRD